MLKPLLPSFLIIAAAAAADAADAATAVTAAAHSFAVFAIAAAAALRRFVSLRRCLYHMTKSSIKVVMLLTVINLDFFSKELRKTEVRSSQSTECLFY